MAYYHPQLELFRAQRDLANLFDNLIELDFSGVSDNTDQQQQRITSDSQQQQQQQQKGLSTTGGKKKGGQVSSFFSTYWTPAVDLAETEKCYKVTAELPGMTKDDINIYFEDNTLVISGEKEVKVEKTCPSSTSSSTATSSSSSQSQQTPSTDDKKGQQQTDKQQQQQQQQTGGQQQTQQQQQQKEERSHWKEIRYGKFERRIGLPQGIPNDKIKAHFENGVLKIEIPKPEVKPGQRKQIAIE